MKDAHLPGIGAYRYEEQAGHSAYICTLEKAENACQSSLGRRRAVEQNRPEFDPLLQLGTGALRETGTQKLVETPPSFLWWHMEMVNGSGRSHPARVA